jgi:hypothetical protein
MRYLRTISASILAALIAVNLGSCAARGPHATEDSATSTNSICNTTAEVDKALEAFQRNQSHSFDDAAKSAANTLATVAANAVQADPQGQLNTTLATLSTAVRSISAHASGGDAAALREATGQYLVAVQEYRSQKAVACPKVATR